TPIQRGMTQNDGAMYYFTIAGVKKKTAKNFAGAISSEFNSGGESGWERACGAPRIMSGKISSGAYVSFKLSFYLPTVVSARPPLSAPVWVSLMTLPSS